jgi:hypothetical protein
VSNLYITLICFFAGSKKDENKMKKNTVPVMILAVVFMVGGPSCADLKDLPAAFAFNGNVNDENSRLTGNLDDIRIYNGALCKAKINELHPKNSSATHGVIEFSDYKWTVKSSSDASDTRHPGPNLWSNRKSDVWVDDEGRLHLKIVKRKGRWYCTEITCDTNFGYGTYVFYLDSEIEDSSLDPDVVLGFFTWDDNTCDTNASSEIDIEFSKYGGRRANILNYTVQPCIVTGGRPISECHKRHKVSPIKLNGTYSTHVFVWNPGSVQFYSYHGHGNPTPNPIVKGGWVYDNTIPNCKCDRDRGAQCDSKLIGIPKETKNTKVKINFWLFEGKEPQKEQHIIINKFKYIPASLP